MQTPIAEPRHWLDRPIAWLAAPRLETLLIALIFLLAIFSRFYDLGARVMSHDEINHVTPSFELSQGRGYRYNPVTHGPLQFHLIALSYFLFGDNDFTSRIPSAAFSVAAVLAVMLLFRRYLGRTGALLAGVMLLISPTILFYGRYARNESFTVLWGILTLYCMLRYLERGGTGILFLFTLVNALHFVDKATSYIFAAEELLFLGFYLVYSASRARWQAPAYPRRFVAFLAAAILLAGLGVSGLMAGAPPGAAAASGRWIYYAGALLLVGALANAFAALAMMVKGMGWEAIRRLRSFDLLVLLGTLILPLLAALPLKIAGYNPMDTSTAGILRSLAFIFPLLVLAVAAGYWWKRGTWLAYAGLFYGVFALFYTTIFSYPEGLATGWMGALSYWMAQQSVNRGGQPWFYYAFLLVPVYEYLPAFGALAAAFIGWRRGLWSASPERPFEPPARVQEEEPIPAEVAADNVPADPNDIPADPLDTRTEPNDAQTDQPETPAGLPDAPPAPALGMPTLALLIYWSCSSLLAFTLAGEKMPWLTVDIALPLILASGWGLGYLIETWNAPPLGRRAWLRSLGLGFFALLAVLTFRTAFRAAYINYDNAMEYLVYAHAAADPKFVLAQIEDISRRTTDGLDIVVAYDNDTRYPYWWYMRHYPNRIDYDVKPTRELQKAAVIMVGEDNYPKIEPIVGNNYLVFNYTRLWWPNQDYWRLKWDEIDAERSAGSAPGDPPPAPMTIFEYFAGVWRHLRPFFTDPAVRSAVWQIWLNRDYSQYAVLQKNNNLTLATWQPSNHMRMYIRKDVAAQIWGGGGLPAAPTTASDPYTAVTVQASPEKTIGSPGTAAGQFQSPRAIAAAPDGSLYVADSRNNRVQHLSSDGKLINAWGTFADASKGAAPGGTFNEPWGIALGPDGSVYVSDTWNHRVEKFTADGQFVSMWGHFGQAEAPDAFWGPRGIAVDPAGRVYVVDTGNKRVVVFDSSGKAIAQFGQAGIDPGQFDEPVGIALDADGKIYVADTWNQRVQVFNPDFTANTFSPAAQFAVEGWHGQSVENKPFIAVDPQGRVYVTDPDAARVLEFNPGGAILKVWSLSNGSGSNLPAGITLDSRGSLWVSDASQQRLEEYANPAPDSSNKQ